MGLAAPGAMALDAAFLADIQRKGLEALGEAICSEGEFCAPATEAEFAEPPLDMEVADGIATQAIYSAMADNCGLDFANLTFLPMMRWMRGTGDFSQRQVALAGLMHGITMGSVAGREELACSERTRALLASRGIE